jgi:hypothetical protein
VSNGVHERPENADGAATAVHAGDGVVRPIVDAGIMPPRGSMEIAEGQVVQLMADGDERGLPRMAEALSTISKRPVGRPRGSGPKQQSKWLATVNEVVVQKKRPVGRPKKTCNFDSEDTEYPQVMFLSIFLFWPSNFLFSLCRALAEKKYA